MKSISLSGPIKLSLEKTAAAIGVFDGVHRGHQRVIKAMLVYAKRYKLKPIVITFFPHPSHVMRPEVKLTYITSLEERMKRLRNLGVELCLIITFDRRFAKISPEGFIKDILVKKLDVKALFVGENFRFGKDRSGGVSIFQKLSLIYGYKMHAVDSLKQGKRTISSSRIRHLIEEAKLKEAFKLLGCPYAVIGKVVKGDGRGKKLGFPTANVAYEEDLLAPAGVYAVQLKLGKHYYPAMANLGLRPTFEVHPEKLHLEVFVFDFAKNIYGKEVEVEFFKKIRNEKKFASPQQLIQQIKRDEIVARKYFK